MKRKRRVVRKNTVSQFTLNKQMREIWINGFGFYPMALGDVYIDKVRIAMKSLVADDLYWQNLKKLRAIKDDAARMVERLKAGGAA